jgi:hypothetical protein
MIWKIESDLKNFRTRVARQILSDEHVPEGAILIEIYFEKNPRGPEAAGISIDGV